MEANAMEVAPKRREGGGGAELELEEEEEEDNEEEEGESEGEDGMEEDENGDADDEARGDACRRGRSRPHANGDSPHGGDRDAGPSTKLH